MSYGMKVQCSILEGHVKNLQASTVLHPMGNELPYDHQYEQTSTWADTTSSGMPTPASPYATPYDCGAAQVANAIGAPALYTTLKNGLMVPAPYWGKWPAVSENYAYNGWQTAPVGDGYQYIAVYAGLARNALSIAQPYYIWEHKISGPWNNSNPVWYCLGGVPYTISEDTLVSAGIIDAHKVIGVDIPFPFPTAEPSPFEKNGDAVVSLHYIFAQIGMNPGTFTKVTGITVPH
jgi:hypothetical protein